MNTVHLGRLLHIDPTVLFPFRDGIGCRHAQSISQIDLALWVSSTMYLNELKIEKKENTTRVSRQWGRIPFTKSVVGGVIISTHPSGINSLSRY